jgi:hypothetical protein
VEVRRRPDDRIVLDDSYRMEFRAEGDVEVVLIDE